MIKLLTPLVLGTVVIVSVLSVVQLILKPESWASSLIALAFLPLSIGILLYRSGSASDPSKARKVSGKLRAALVGAGVILATSLLLSITDYIGITLQKSEGAIGTLIALLSAMVVVAVDILSARLERKAEEDSE